jgi:low temperature requirement protein LtrA
MKKREVSMTELFFDLIFVYILSGSVAKLNL